MSKQVIKLKKGKSLKNIPSCQPQLLKDLSVKITEFANIWMQSDIRPDFLPELKFHWDKLIRDWADDDSMPLFIRKPSLGRGSIIFHNSGRKLIPTDNSPAIWAYSACLLEERFSLDNIKNLLNKDEIPISLALKANELIKAKYKCKLSSVNLNQKGWKLAHINPVGIKKRLNEDNFKNLPIEELITHFVKFMSPSNMFLIPKRWSGMAEVPEVIDVFKV